jgi:hypothetical protein
MATTEDLTTVDEALARFDALPPVALEEMLGEWDGEVVRTGHPGEAQLGGLRWLGKTFRSRDDVDPMVCAGADGGREASAIMGPASLRMVEFRGVVTATMCYDKHPIFDHFRRVDEDTVLGVMDRKGEDRPLVFTLRRRAAPA